MFIALSILLCGTAFSQILDNAVSGKFICDEQHPRCAVQDQSQYKYNQFGGRHVGQYSGVSNLLKNGPPLEHYQTWLTEVITERPDTNVVASWSDAKSVVDKGRVWGGFISARSQFNGKIKDSQLIGLEIDVLNAGLPGVSPNQSKVGLQIVGFGNRVTNAIEVLNDGGKDSNSQWQNVLNVQPGAVASDGTIIGVGPQNAAIGIDFRNSTFNDSAFLISEDQKLTFRKNGEIDAAVYRDNFGRGHLVLQSGPDGLRITNAENNKNLAIIKNDGDIITAQGALSNILNRLTQLENKLKSLKTQ